MLTEKQIKSNTGKVLAKLQETKGVTLKGLCDATNMNQGTYGRLRAGTADLRLIDIAKIADYYEIPEYLLVCMIIEDNISAVAGEVANG